ncbi:hypothetical protein MJL30_38180, partial [Salmonella enterica subsp. enterica serovar Anatum]|nr:hypothetical protein [Salmonella enterica subsp. enterica serovar Anatum]
NKAVGQDYSRWNDVWLTLRGQYGARSTAKDAADPNSTVMYVAHSWREVRQTGCSVVDYRQTSLARCYRYYYCDNARSRHKPTMT